MKPRNEKGSLKSCTKLLGTLENSSQGCIRWIDGGSYDMIYDAAALSNVDMVSCAVPNQWDM